jgi:hypothetical protein
VLTLGGGIVFTPIAAALTVVALRRTRPETLVDFGALLVGAAAVAFYTLMFVWTVGLVLYEGAALSLTPEVASESRLRECAGMSLERSDLKQGMSLEAESAAAPGT